MSNHKGSTLESRKDNNLLPLPNPTMNDTSTLVFLYWKHEIIQNKESNSEQSDHNGEGASEAETNRQPAQQLSQVPI